MLNVTAAQLDAWVVAVIYPLVRILGMMSTAPLFNNRAFPVRTRVAFGVAVSMAVIPALPPIPHVPTNTGVAHLILIQQLLIGLAIGFVIRVSFSAIDLAGEIIGMQMGLSFATIYDPINASQTSVLSEFISVISSLVFLSMNGHLLLIDTMVKSFTLLPVTDTFLAGKGWIGLAQFGTVIFVAGLLMALPVIAALLITNIGLGVLTRAAPQLNLFSIGFPITMSIGMIMLMLTMPRLDTLLQGFYDQSFAVLGQWLRQVSSTI